MERITEAFVWPFRDPDWLGKLAVIALLMLVPIVGGINGLGWMLAGIDRLRSADERLPPGNFRYIGRGFQLFVVYLVYYLGVAVVAAVFYLPAILLLSQQGRETTSAVLVGLAFGLMVLTFSWVTVGLLALTFAMPAIVLAVDAGGMGAGLHAGEIVQRIRSSPINTLIAGLMLIAAGLIGQLGAVLCVIGVLLTSAYALAMQAWIIRSYEVGASAPST